MKNSTKFDSDLKHKLKNHYQDQLKHLKKKGYAIQKVPKHIKALRSEGEAYAVAYPIQGILKYHGMADPLNRTAFFSSISLNNSSAKTVTYVKLNRNLRKDQLILDGEPVLETDRRFERVKIQLDKIREFAKIEDSNALIISRNIQKMNKKIPKLKKVTGKGIGTSASAGAAIAEAMTCILYDKNPKYTQNIQLKSHFARF